MSTIPGEPESICRFTCCGETTAPHSVFCPEHHALNMQMITRHSWSVSDATSEKVLKALDVPAEWIVRFYKRLTPEQQARLKELLADFAQGKPFPQPPPPAEGSLLRPTDTSLREANAWLLLEHLAAAESTA